MTDHPKRPKLPRGWSWPLTATEVVHQFPAATQDRWVGGDTRGSTQAFFVLGGTWLPPTPTAPTPRLWVTIHAVPSAARQAVRADLASSLGIEVETWFAQIANQPPTWRSEQHSIAWRWPHLEPVFRSG